MLLLAATPEAVRYGCTRRSAAAAQVSLWLLRHKATTRGCARQKPTSWWRFSTSAPSVRFPSDTTVLVCSTIAVEPTASAAGVRTSYLLERLVESPGVSSVHFASPSVLDNIDSKKVQNDSSATTTVARWKHKGVFYHELMPNRSAQARELLLDKLPKTENLLVIFDRFYAEEMYSFFLHKLLPHATLVLDMQDFHALRGYRQKWIKQQQHQQGHAQDFLSNLPIATSPGTDDSNLLRELASIHRSDVTLVCSSVELALLTEKYQIPNNKLCLAPLFGDLPSEESSQRGAAFRYRSDFCFVGGFRHEPNVDAVQQLKRLWPGIRDQIIQRNCSSSTVNVHVYGAYCSDHLRRELHAPETGFFVHGHSPWLVDELLANKRVLLSPIRFGAGIKGKHVDAWKAGLPVVTTPIGSEGMNDNTQDYGTWGGIVARTDADFISAAACLYNDEALWNTSVSGITPLLSKLCGPGVWNHVALGLVGALEKRLERRQQDFTRSILWHQSVRSTEFFSKYIEQKEKTS